MSGAIYECFRQTASRQPQRTAMMYKDGKGEYVAVSYQELSDSVNRVAASIRALGIRKGDRIAIFSYNRPEWGMVDLAALKLGAIVVPIYHTLPSSAVRYIINDSSSKLIFVEDAKLFAIVEEIRGETPSIDRVVVFDPKEIGADKGFLRFADLKKDEMTVDESVFGDIPPLSPDDTATIVYTSGTTGDPKGVVLLHGNIVSNALSAVRRFTITPDDVFLSFLPLCHMFERTCGYYTLLFAGGSIGYAQDISTVIEDIRKIRPTILLVVPRIIEKAYEMVVEEVEKGSPIRRALVLSSIRNLNQYANLKYKGMRIPLGLRLKCLFCNALVASKFRKLAGGRVRVIVSGAAPLDRQIAKVFYVLGFNIMEGYGLTEASPVVSSGTVEENKLGTVGKPFDDVEVRIAEHDEILVRGPNVMQGYHNKPEETARAIDEQGWLHTGDQGRFDEDGNLVITGRIKEIIVTSYGKNVAPVAIETEIKKSEYIDQAMLYGDNKKYITALIASQREALERYADERNVLTSDYAALLSRDDIRTLIASEIERATAHLAPFEKVKAFTLLPDTFTVENGLLTPTLKMRRTKIVERYWDQIQSMYAKPEGI